MCHDVEKFAAADRIVYDMAVWPHPQRAVLDVNAGRYRISRRHSAPADTAGEARRVGAEQARADRGVNTVCADHDVGLDFAAVGKARYRNAVASLDRDAALADTDVGRLQRFR